MEPVAIIIGALAAAAALAAKETTTQATKDAYTGLKSMLLKRFREKKFPEGETALMKFEEKPDVWKEPLKDALSESGADKTEEIIKATEVLVKILTQFSDGRKALSKYTVNVENSEVGIIGDNAVVHEINFGKKGD